MRWFVVIYRGGSHLVCLLASMVQYDTFFRIYLPYILGTRTRNQICFRIQSPHHRLLNMIHFSEYISPTFSELVHGTRTCFRIQFPTDKWMQHSRAPEPIVVELATITKVQVQVKPRRIQKYATESEMFTYKTLAPRLRWFWSYYSCFLRPNADWCRVGMSSICKIVRNRSHYRVHVSYRW